MAQELSGQKGEDLMERAVNEANRAKTEGEDNKNLKKYTNAAAK